MKQRPGRNIVMAMFIVGPAVGGLIGMTLVIVSMLFFMAYVVGADLILILAGVLGSVTGAIFAPITYPFIRHMDIPKVVGCLAGGTFIFGMIPSIVFYCRLGEDMPILNWPAGMLGYWITFLFRHELVGLINWWQAWRHPKPEQETNADAARNPE